MVRVIALLLAGLAVAQACMPTSWEVTKVGDGAVGNMEGAYTLDQIQEVVAGMDMFTGHYVKPHKVSYSCVDSRSTPNIVPFLQTPGGDMAELIGAMVIYFRLTEITPSHEAVQAIMKKFIKREASAERPFYFHTAIGNMNMVFDTYANLTGAERPSVLPFMGPEDEAETEAWLDALSRGPNQGCGHVKYMINMPADFGLTEDEYMIPVWAIKSLYQYFWWTEMGSPARSKVILPGLLGPLTGKAVTIIAKTNTSCYNQKYPVANPNHAGSDMFLYYGDAVAAFRETTLTDFFHYYLTWSGDKGSFTKAEFSAQLAELQNTMLGATLALLPPANNVPIYQVTVASSEE